MVGITLVNGEQRPDEDTLTSAHTDCCFDDRYSLSIGEQGDTAIITCAFPSYPLTSVTGENRQYIIEGIAYNRGEDEFHDEIQATVGGYCDGTVDADAVTEWLAGIDGEFVIYAVDQETGDITIVRDLLAQLPLFYTVAEDTTYIGRNKHALATLQPTVEFDPTAIACYLALGYIPGDDTFYTDIKDIPRGSIVEVGDDVSITDAHTLTVHETEHADRSIEANAQELADRFRRACRRRAERTPGTNTIFLTGGLDSRGVLAAFNGQGLDHVTATRYYEPYDGERDVSVAGELAETTGSDWHRFDIGSPTGRHLEDHLTMSSGSDPLHVGHIQVFFQAVREKIGDPVTFYTGDGGDKIFPDHRPARNVSSIDDVVEYILTNDQYFSLETVEAVTGVGRDELSSHLREIIEEYPVSNPTQQYIHFQIAERAGSWLFEATDTNRNHSWTTTPYYALPVFEYAMNCPDDQKRWHRLFTTFLEKLSPELTAIQNSNFGASPTEYQYIARVIGLEILQRYPAVYDRVIPLVREALGMSNTGSVEPVLRDSLKSHIEDTTLPDGVDESALQARIFDDLSEYSRNQRYHVLTLLAVIDRMDSDTPVLSEYTDTQFGQV